VQQELLLAATTDKRKLDIALADARSSKQKIEESLANKEATLLQERQLFSDQKKQLEESVLKREAADTEIVNIKIKE